MNNTTSTAVQIIRPLALGLAVFGACSAIGGAQAPPNPCPSAAPWNAVDPAYNTVDAWQTGWDAGNYDRNHILLGTVGSFSPYRLTMLNQQGDSRTIDMKNGTVILPTGTTPAAGQKVAVFGYWSNGTFIANRVMVHP